MDKINWCANKREGLKLIEPNSNLAQAYLSKAKDALESISLNKIKEWKISTAYYSIYFSVYAILTRIGIKCEIHSCTIAFANVFLKDYFSDEELEFLNDALKARIDTQYYINKQIPNEQFEEIIKRAPEFFIKCKSILSRLNEQKIKEIRNNFEKSLNKS